MSRTLTAGLVLLAAWAPETLAWGPLGHRAVGRVAERHLNPKAAQAVAELLGPEQLAYVALWADEIRSDPEWTKADSWHWVTIGDGQTYAASAKNPKGDVLEALARFQKTLADKSAPRLERVQALKWLTHLVGDIHQPLHVGRGDDEGGNQVLVTWFGEPTNLHSVWDGKIIESQQLSFSEVAELVDHATAAEIGAWQSGTAQDWATESQELRAACYKLGDRKLSYRYIYEHWPTVQRRILQAGVRLAGELNRLLGAP